MEAIIRFLEVKVDALEQQKSKYVTAENGYVRLTKCLEEMPEKLIKDALVCGQKFSLTLKIPKSSEPNTYLNVKKLAELLGEDWSTEISTKQTIDIVNGKIDKIQQQIKRLDALINDFHEKKESLLELDNHNRNVNEHGLPIVDIQELLDDEDNIVSSNIPMHTQATVDTQPIDELQKMMDKVELEANTEFESELEMVSPPGDEEIDEFEHTEYDDLEHIVGEFNIEFSSDDDEYSDIPTDESEDEYGMTQYVLPERPILSSAARGTRKVRFKEGTVDNEKPSIPKGLGRNRQYPPSKGKESAKVKQGQTQNKSFQSDSSLPVDVASVNNKSDHKPPKIPVKSEIVERVTESLNKQEEGTCSMRQTIVEQVSDNDIDSDLHAKEVAVEYHRLRQNMIAQHGGYVEQDEEIVPLEEEYFEDENGKMRKVSRFKAARLGR